MNGETTGPNGPTPAAKVIPFPARLPTQQEYRWWRVRMLREAHYILFPLADNTSLVDDEAYLLERLALILRLVTESIVGCQVANSEPKPMRYSVELTSLVTFHSVLVEVDKFDVGEMAEIAMGRIYNTIINVLGETVSYSGAELKNWTAIPPDPGRPVNGGAP